MDRLGAGIIVLDANAAAAMVEKKPEGQIFRDLLLEGEYVVAPDLFLCETANIAWKYRCLANWSDEAARVYRERANALVDEFTPVAELVTEAYEEAVRVSHSVYDLFYLVLARRTGGTLLTLDKKLARLANELHVNCAGVVDS